MELQETDIPRTCAPNSYEGVYLDIAKTWLDFVYHWGRPPSACGLRKSFKELLELSTKVKQTELDKHQRERSEMATTAGGRPR